MTQATIIVGTTNAVVQMSQMPENVCRQVEKALNRQLLIFEFDPRTKRYKPTDKFYKYNYHKKTFIVPITYVSSVEEALAMAGVRFITKRAFTYSPRKIDITIPKCFVDREAQIPIIKQLSKPSPPRKGLLMQTGCLIGSTMVDIAQGEIKHHISMQEAYDKYNQLTARHSWDRELPITIRSLVGDSIQYHSVEDIVYSGKKAVFEVTLANGRVVVATACHRFKVKDGFLPVEKLNGQEVACEHGEGIIYSKVANIVYQGVQDTYDICCAKPYHNFVANGVVVHNSGKTYCALKTAKNLGVVFMVVVSGLTEQWLNAINQMTSIYADTWLIKGGKSLVDLFNSDIKPKAFVVSLETLREYVKGKGNYQDLPRYPEFLKRYGVGLKIIDEVHLALHATTMIDLAANVPLNIYLSATFGNSNKQVDKVFNGLYPTEMRCESIGYKKYTRVIFYGHHGSVSERKVSTARGYSHIKYEQQLLCRQAYFDDWFNRVLLPIMREHYVKTPVAGKLKALIFCSTSAMIEQVRDALRTQFPQYKTMEYLHKSPESVLEEADIIVSTHKGAGTGNDIKHLYLVVDTISFKSHILAYQVLGRLRILNDSSVANKYHDLLVEPNKSLTPVYVGMLDLNLSSHTRHWTDRACIFKQCAKEYKNYTIT